MLCTNCSHNLTSTEGKLCPNCGQQVATQVQTSAQAAQVGGVTPKKTAKIAVLVVLVTIIVGVGGFFSFRALTTHGIVGTWEIIEVWGEPVIFAQDRVSFFRDGTGVHLVFSYHDGSFTPIFEWNNDLTWSIGEDGSTISTRGFSPNYWIVEGARLIGHCPLHPGVQVVIFRRVN